MYLHFYTIIASTHVLNIHVFHLSCKYGRMFSNWSPVLPPFPNANFYLRFSRQNSQSPFHIKWIPPLLKGQRATSPPHPSSLPSCIECTNSFSLTPLPPPSIWNVKSLVYIKAIVWCGLVSDDLLWLRISWVSMLAPPFPRKGCSENVRKGGGGEN